MITRPGVRLKTHDCCNDDHLIEPDPRDQGQRNTLKWVLGIHTSMFVVTALTGWFAGSTVVMAESVDFLSHIFLLFLSLFAAHHGTRWIARASLVKGATMFLVGSTVLLDALKRTANGIPPNPEAIGMIGVLGVSANLATMALLKKFGTQNLNLHSSYLCSRNDVLTHLGIIATSALVGLTGSRWPDTVIGCFLSLLILRSAVHVTKRSVLLLKGESASFRVKPSEA